MECLWNCPVTVWTQLMLQHFICALLILSFCGCEPLFPNSIASSLSLGPKQKAKSKTQGSKDLSSTPGLAVSSCESVGKALTSQSLTHFVCNMKPSPSPPQLSVTTSLQMSPHHFQGNHSFCPGFPLHDDFYVFHFSIIVLKWKTLHRVDSSSIGTAPKQKLQETLQ